jgi:dipeptidyl aminopeptidase/acylaminoacyl peptidase
VSNGQFAVGVIDSLTVPPEFAAVDLSTGTTTVLTNLNPALRGRRYGDVEQLVFSTPFDSVNTGWLIKPVGFVPERRYPLVVLHADEPERPRDRSYLLDGRHNLSGHAAQPLAALGFMVLYIGAPPSSRPGARTEIETVRVSIEEAIRALAKRGYVDTLRVGVSGWSRSGWFVEQLLVHSQFPFAAATLIDGGTAVYNEGNRPYSDAELERISTPVLIEPHGLIMFASASGMRDRLRALGKAVDLLYFPNAPHATRQPSQRWRSLTTHVDWWRFWLQDHEDPDPSKAEQYRRWRALPEHR